MNDFIKNKFVVKLRNENNYYRIHITHPSFKGRIRKRIGEKNIDDAENICLNIKFELFNKFQNSEMTKGEVVEFIDNFISLNIKMNASIFDYKDEFINYKKVSKNKLTNKILTKSTISGYLTALKYFEEFFIKHHIPQHPSQITDSTLNGLYDYLSGSHNYRVKIHNKVKGFIKFLIQVKNMNIDNRYKLSVYNEKYDNQCPDEGDRALTEKDVRKLIRLKRQLQSGEISFEAKPLSNKIPVELQMKNKEKMATNMVKSLDCFLFMLSTGMYHADVKNSKVYFSRNGNVHHVRYRRSKSGSLSKAIPIKDDGIFIAGEIIEQYGITDGTNFPLNLSLTHFAKHLKRISKLAGIKYNITNKMARKTFASRYYFVMMLPIHLLQIMLAHKDVRDTMHYLRISDDDLAGEIAKWCTSRKVMA